MVRPKQLWIIHLSVRALPSWPMPPVVGQGLRPRLAGGSLPAAALVVNLALLLAGAVAGRIAWARAQAAALSVTLACGAESMAVRRLRRETAASCSGQ